MDYVQKITKQPVVNEWEFFDDEVLVKAVALSRSNYREGVLEFHKSYTDLHITIEGLDIMYTSHEISETIEPYQEAGDYALVLSPTLNANKIPPGHFILIPPNEIHANQLEGENPLKVVFKLKP